MSGPSYDTFRRFIAGANAQLRTAGLGQYAMRAHRDGTVTQPKAPPPEFGRTGTGEAAGSQAKAGAAAASQGTASASADTPRSGAAPEITGVKQGGTDAFQLEWKPLEGAKQYGIWQDGVLIGHVPNPSFAAQLAVGASSVLQVDAVLANGTRTQLTSPLQASRGQDGKMAFGAAGGTAATSNAAAGAATVGATATAPAAAAG